MTLHVDMVHNEPDTGLQVCVGRVRVRQGKLDVERFDAGQCWEDTVSTRDLVDPETGNRVDPHDQPERYLELLHRAMNLPVLFATEVHRADECPFPSGKELRDEPSDMTI